MKASQPLLNPHRTARLISWAVAMLSWVALVLCGERFAKSRHVRQRHGFVSLAWLKALLCALVVARAADMTPDRHTPSRQTRNAAPRGFRRRINRAGKARAILGARLRRALAAPTAHGRIERLIAAFSDLDGFTRRYLLARAQKRLTKLCAIIMHAPPADAAASIAAPFAPACADTS